MIVHNLVRKTHNKVRRYKIRQKKKNPMVVFARITVLSLGYDMGS